MDETKKLLKEYWESAPTENQLVIQNIIDHPMVISLMATKNKVDPAKASNLQNEMILILLGLEPVSSFRANLVRELDISYDQALKIAFDANAQFFGGVMETLKQMDVAIKNIESEDVGEETTERTARVETVRTGLETHPDRMIPDHNEMERVDGIHLHSQSVMPDSASVAASLSKPAPEPVRSSFFHHNTEPKPTFGSIIDQKLRNIVRSPMTNTSAPTLSSVSDVKDEEKGKSTNGYSGNDPYREPIQ